MSFTNLYYKRTAGTAKACYVCDKPTTTVLATINTVDFLYACPNHLTDSGFATIVPNEPSVSAEEIARVKAEWEEKLKKKLEKEREREREKTASENDKEAKKTSDSKDESTDSTKQASKSPQLPGSLSTSTPPSKPQHERYILHREYFAMRQDAHRRRRQATQAKELAPRLPGAPKGNI